MWESQWTVLTVVKGFEKLKRFSQVRLLEVFFWILIGLQPLLKAEASTMFDAVRWDYTAIFLFLFFVSLPLFLSLHFSFLPMSFLHFWPLKYSVFFFAASKVFIFVAGCFRVCLDRAYFAETENWKLKIL